MSTSEQFLIVAIAHFFAVVSPGPDFAVVLSQSLRYNRKIAIYTSLGIAAGIIVHVTYSLVGIGLIIASNELLFTLLKYIAAAYFIYIAWQCFKAKKPEVAEPVNSDLIEKHAIRHNENIAPLERQVTANRSSLVLNNSSSLSLLLPSQKKAFVKGFLINALNVKATLFFVSLFSLVVTPETELNLKLYYGLYLVLATAAWFCFLSYVLTHSRVRSLIQRRSYIIERIMGVVLLILAYQLVFSNVH